MNRQLLILFEFQHHYWMHIFHLQMSEVCFLCRDPVPDGKSQREWVEMPASIASASLSKNFHRCRNMYRLPYCSISVPVGLGSYTGEGLGQWWGFCTAATWVLISLYLSFHVRNKNLNPSLISPGFVDNKKAPELLLGSPDLGEKEGRIGYKRVPFTPTKLGWLNWWQLWLRMPSV